MHWPGFRIEHAHRLAHGIGLYSLLSHRLASSLGFAAQRMLGMKVVDARTGHRLTVSQACVRSLALWVASPYLVGVLPLLWDSERQGWHDRVARTLVVKAEPVPVVIRRAWNGARAAI